MVSLLGGADADAAAPASAFYDRLAEAVCRLGSMRRAAVYLVDHVRRRSHLVGTHGIAVDELAGPSSPALPLALRALEHDEILEVRAGLALELPTEDVERLGLADVTCIPMSAGGRPFGVVLAERGDPDAGLGDDEREALWMLGKVCALAASARVATRQQERARQLSDRLELARDVHERVVQRLFGVSLALGGPGELTPPMRTRCAEELQAATEELRDAIQRPLTRPATPEDEPPLREQLRRLEDEPPGPPVAVDWPDDVDIPAALEPLACSVVAEALRNADKHAAATRVDVQVAAVDGDVIVTVANDGAAESSGQPPAGVGLRLAAFEALNAGASVDFGRTSRDRWQVRLTLPAHAHA
ncbi:MAG TPA: GAF domain-containing protein [Baekduia sp.]|nr:GAF domain-containing protein [Baekduia sp.]